MKSKASFTEWVRLLLLRRAGMQTNTNGVQVRRQVDQSAKDSSD